jgi:hypothetical protein
MRVRRWSWVQAPLGAFFYEVSLLKKMLFFIHLSPLILCFLFRNLWSSILDLIPLRFFCLIH